LCVSRGVGWGLILASLGIWAVLIAYAGFGREASFFTACRMEGIALGALLNFGFRFRRPRILASAVAIGIVPLLGSGGPNGFAMTVVGVTLVAILFAVFLQALIETRPEDSVGMRVLRSEPLTRMGKYSYASYLLRMLPLAAVRLHESKGWPPPLLFVGRIVGSYLMGCLSWQVFESRVLLLKRYSVQPYLGTSRSKATPIG